MGKTATEQLNRALSSHLNSIHETLQLFDVAPASSLAKVDWKDVIQMSEQVYKQATNVGMLYAGERPGVKALVENMDAYFSVLQRLLYLSHGSLVGAGATLCSCIHESVKLVVDTSFVLFQEAVSSCGETSRSRSQKIPQFVGAVWDACSNIKKVPTTNVTAIGRAMTQIAASAKDVLRELKELKHASDEISTENNVDDGDSDEDLGNDLSPEEMIIAQLATGVVSDTLAVLREVIRSITSLLKQETSDDSSFPVSSVEKLLEHCRYIGTNIDELGVCLYPPQEISGIKLAVDAVHCITSELEDDLKDLKICTDGFSQAFGGLKDSVRKLESEPLLAEEHDIVPGVENLALEQ